MTDISILKKLFKNKELLNQSLTHKSWVNEHPGQRGSNERLEFLGDAILEFFVSEELFKHFPNKEEGYLTSLRASLVNTSNLAEIAKKLSIGKEIFLSKGEDEGGGRENQSLLADTLEAVIGALYLDQGLKATENFIHDNLLKDVGEKIKKPLKDPKSRFQEYVQAKSFPAPRYQVVEESGPDHAKKFTVEVLVNKKPISRGTGKSKAEAEQAAAEIALASHSL
jgi:ribonuclease-3